MKKKQTIHISIPKPCTQSWDAMPGKEGGRHCGQCNNIVYDFSTLSDAELINFFTTNTTVHCGRFHNSQLNRTITTINERKSFVHRFTKFAATVFAVLSFRAAGAHTGSISKSLITTQPSTKQPANLFVPFKATISGIVINEHNQPLYKASVFFDTTLVVTTDSAGHFSFDVTITEERQYILQFTYNDLVTAVRSYNPVMQSTTYNVSLYERRPHFSMGITIPPYLLRNLPSLSFSKSVALLSSEHKQLLSSLAESLKAHPHASIIIHAYPVKSIAKSVFIRRVNNIRQYLVEQEGIYADRIKLKFTTDGGDFNVVDITEYKEDE
jgi:hypothetical protein